MNPVVDNLIEKKGKIVKIVQLERYEKMIEFINYICLSDVDLIVFLTDSSYNFYRAMLPLAFVENGGVLDYAVSEKYKSKLFRKKKTPPKVITYYAIYSLKEQISKKSFKKILLVDDVIIYNKMLDEKYSNIKKLFHTCGVNEKSYKINLVALGKFNTESIESEFIRSCKTFIDCYFSEWKNLSNDITNIIHICGIVGTSYTPRMTILMDSDIGNAIERALSDDNDMKLTLYEERYTTHYNQLYIYHADNTAPNAIWCSGVRIYKYESQGIYIILPFLSLNPIDGQMLGDYIDCLSEIIDCDVEEDDISTYRSVIYVLSALIGWKFIKDKLQCSISDIEYDKINEEMSFNNRLLKPNVQKELDANGKIDVMLGKISNKYRSVIDLKDILQKDQSIFQPQRILDELVKDYNTEYILVQTKRVLDKFICSMGQFIQEDRLLRYPLIGLNSVLKNQPTDLIDIILSQIDANICSIVPSILMYNDKKYFLPVIYAEKQYYKYYIDNYFPILYGFYFLETIAKSKNKWDCVEEWKKNLLDDYIQYKQPLIFNVDYNDLLKLNVINEYRSILLQELWYYDDNESTDHVLSKAKEIILS